MKAPALQLPATLQPMAAFFTEEIIAAAMSRLLKGTSLPKEMTRAERKLVLMLVRIWNPPEILTEAEESALRGVATNTLAGMKRRNELPRVMNP